MFFKPDAIKLDKEKTSDEFTIFSIPGYDFAISYTSFNRYNFCVFDNDLNAIYLNSEISPNYSTNITLVYDHQRRKLKMYQDAVLVGETKLIKKFYKNYSQEPNIYLGVGRPEREVIPNWFKGNIEYFAHYDTKLSEPAIIDIVENTEELLNKNFKNYIYADNLKTYYDTTFIRDYKLIDLSPHNNLGTIINCEIANQEIITEIETKIKYEK